MSIEISQTLIHVGGDSKMSRFSDMDTHGGMYHQWNKFSVLQVNFNCIEGQLKILDFGCFVMIR